MRKNPIFLLPAFTFCILSSCKKKDNTNQPFNPHVRLTSAVFQDKRVNYFYNTDGSLNRAEILDRNNEVVSWFDYSYTNGRLTSVSTWLFQITCTYPEANTTRINFRNSVGDTILKMDCIMENNRLREWIEYSYSFGTARPVERTVYTYNAAGNIGKKEFYQMENGGWFKYEDVNYVQYDNYTNHTSYVQEVPFFVGIRAFQRNNPLRAEHRALDGTLLKTVEYQYSYDNTGRISRSQIITTEAGQPAVNEIIFYNY